MGKVGVREIKREAAVRNVGWEVHLNYLMASD